MNEKRNSLSRVLGRTDVLALGFGTIVGWTWVALATTWLTEAGFLGAITAFTAASVIIFGVGLLYGELTSALPLAGGELVYAYRATGFKGGWAVGWILAFAYIGAASWQSICWSRRKLVKQKPNTPKTPGAVRRSRRLFCTKIGRYEREKRVCVGISAEKSNEVEEK